MYNSWKLFFIALLSAYGLHGMEAPPRGDVNKKIISEIRAGDLEAFKKLLPQVNPNYDDKYMTILGYILQAPAFCPENERWADIYVQMLKLLVQRGVNINALQLGQLPLGIASRNCPESMVPALLDLGADVNLRSAGGRNALFYAVTHSGPRGIIMLLAAGVDRNARDEFGETATSDVSEEMRSRELEILNHRPDQLLQDAIRYNVEWAVRRLVNSENINTPDADGITPLGYAVDYHQAHLADVLIDLGADPNLTYGNTRLSPLQSATSMAYDDVAAVLRRHGAMESAQGGEPRQQEELRMRPLQSGWFGWLFGGGAAVGKGG